MSKIQDDCTVFIRTYAGDAGWLRYCLASLRKHEPDVRCVVVCPQSDHDEIHPIAAEHGALYDVLTPLHEDGYMDQQWTKLHADNWCKTKYIVHVDSACLFLQPLDALFEDGKPLMLKTPWEDIEQYNGEHVWNRITANAIGFRPGFEYMRRQPLTYPRLVYSQIRQHLEDLHGSLSEWFLNLPHRELSEYNVMGAWCDTFAKEHFRWINTREEPLPPLVARQGWSWGGLSKVKAEWDAILNDDNE